MEVIMNRTILLCYSRGVQSEDQTTCCLDNVRSSWKIIQVTFSVRGGVLRDPLYVQKSAASENIIIDTFIGRKRAREIAVYKKTMPKT